MELEFITLDKATEEVEWLRQFLKDISWWSKLVSAITIHCDSQSTIGRAQSNMYNGKSKYIRRRSKDNITDPLTKWSTQELVDQVSKGMGLKPMKEKDIMKEKSI